MCQQVIVSNAEDFGSGIFDKYPPSTVKYTGTLYLTDFIETNDKLRFHRCESIVI